jgi:Protein of unknown function (DUF3500)
LDCNLRRAGARQSLGLDADGPSSRRHVHLCGPPSDGRSLVPGRATVGGFDRTICRFCGPSHEGLRGLDLVNSLLPEQAKVAVVSTEPFFSDVLTGVGRRNSLSRFEGLPAGDLDPAQKRLLLALVDEYVRNADVDAAERHLDAMLLMEQLHYNALLSLLR